MQAVGSALSSPPRLEDPRGLAILREEWNDLAVAVGGGIFATWEWADAWLRHHGRGRERLVHSCRGDDGRLETVIPLYVWRQRRPRVLRFIGHGPSDALGPIHSTAERHRVDTRLMQTLANLKWDVFAGEQLPGGESWSARLGGRTWRREPSPVLHVGEGGWDAYLSDRSANFRQQLGRRWRALKRAGTVRFRLAEAGTLDADLDLLFALHQGRWRGGSTDFTDTPFHRDVAWAALQRGWLRLWFLEVNDQPVAAWHGFQVGRIANYYQAGRDPAYERLSVGFVLLAHTVRSAIEEGAAEYRFGRGGEPFKYRFTEDDLGLESVALTRGIPGRLALECARGARRTRDIFRDWVR